MGRSELGWDDEDGRGMAVVDMVAVGGMQFKVWDTARRKRIPE